VTDDGGPGGAAAGGAPAGPRGRGHGIAGMRERAATFGGRVSAGPAGRPYEGRGWRVRTVLPLAPATPGDHGWRVRTVLPLAPATPGDQGAARAEGTLAGPAAEDG
jgi:hypothetical protein